MKKILLFFVLLSSNIFSQTVENIKLDKENYIWGEGVGLTVKLADQYALSELISQIYVNVENTSTNTINETNKKINKTWNEELKTHSNVSLPNTHKIIIPNGKEPKVFRYIKRSEVCKIFENRKNKIIEFVRNGETSLENLQISDALRYLYWAQTLLRSHTESSNIKMVDSQGNDVLLITWIPMTINNIFINMSIKMDKGSIFDVRYKDKLVKNFDYICFYGKDSTNGFTKDGETTIINHRNLRIKSKYVYINESNIDSELYDVMVNSSQINYNNSYINVEQKKEYKIYKPIKEEIKKSICGRLNLYTNIRGVGIYINGQYKGETPNNIVLKNGDYILQLKKDGYNTIYKSFIISGETIEINENLNRK